MDPTETGISADKKRLRVLLVAYQCAPEGGSVAMIGYRWVQNLAAFVDIHLVTHIRHKQELEGSLPENVTVTFVDTEWFASPLHRLARKFFFDSQHILFMVSNLDFLLFDFLTCRKMRRIHKQQPFDICHMVTPVTPVSPHKMGSIGPPTLVGPLNGAMPPFKNFPEIATQERAWLYPLRKLVRFLVWVRGTYRNVSVIMVASQQTRKDLGDTLIPKFRDMCENGVMALANEVPPFPAFPPHGPLELVFVGRLIPVKGIPYLLKAMSRLDGINLRIVGTGPQEPYLRKLVAQLKLDGRVSFLGFQTQAALTAIYRSCHVHVLPSVRESGGATILEAMGQGRPSVGLNNGGPADYIKGKCGILLPCESSEQVTQDLENCLMSLKAHPERIPPMGAASLRYVRSRYTWPSKIQTALGYYREVLGESPS